MPEDIGQALLNVDVRPVRLGYAAREASVDDFRSAVLEASSRWGGMQEPILPVGADGHIVPSHMGLLDRMPVDYLCSISDELRPQAAELQEQVHRQVVTLQYVQTHLAVHATHVQPEQARPSNVIGARHEDPVTSLAALGAAWDPDQITAWQGVGLNVFPQPFGLGQLVGAQFNGSSLITATAAQCSESAVYGLSGVPLVIWLTAPDSLDDAWAYWNFRTLIPRRLSFVPSCLLPLPIDDMAPVRVLVEAVCARRPFHSDPDMIVFSHSIDTPAAEHFIQALGAREYDGDAVQISWSSHGHLQPSQPLTALLANPTQLVAVNRDLGQRTVVPTYLRRRKTIVSVDSPVRFRALGGDVRLRFSGPSAFSIPESPSAVKLFDANAIQAQGCVEIATTASNHYTVHLDVPQRIAVLSAYLQDQRLAHDLSDKGQLARGVLNATPDIARLRNPVALAVIDSLTTHRFSHELDEARKLLPEMDEAHLEQLIHAVQNTRQTSRTLEQVFLEVRATCSEVERPHVGAALGSLADAHMLARGFLVVCELCGIRSFIELRTAGAPALCPGCGSSATYEIDPTGQPAIHYRLNALLDRASDQGVLGHVVVEAALRDRFGYDDLINLPGVNLVLADHSTREIDSLALIQKDLWIGEVKPRSEYFTDEQLNRDLALGEAIGAQTYLIACMAGIDQSRIDAALDAAVQHGMQLAVLDAADTSLRILTRYDVAAIRSHQEPPPAEAGPAI